MKTVTSVIGSRLVTVSSQGKLEKNQFAFWMSNHPGSSGGLISVGGTDSRLHHDEIRSYAHFHMHSVNGFGSAGGWISLIRCIGKL